MNEETISQKLRRWADNADSNTIRRCLKEVGIDCKDAWFPERCASLLGYIAGEIEKEQQAIIDAQSGGIHGSTLSAHHIIKTWAENNKKPMQDGESITKWLDRWFLAYPVDDNGEPWHIGDQVDGYNDPEATIAGFGLGGQIIARNSMKAGYLYPSNPDYHLLLQWDINDCKRPTKAFDANGESTSVGDTVYDRDGNKGTVKEIVSSERITVLWGTCYSHDERADQLTHREPDSLENLRDDMNAYVDGGLSCIEDDIRDFSKRLTAIMERDA